MRNERRFGWRFGYGKAVGCRGGGACSTSRIKGKMIPGGGGLSPIGNHAEVVQMWEAFLSHLEGQSVPDLTMDGFRQWVVSSERGLAILGRFLNFFLTGPKDRNSSFIAKSLDIRKQYATTWPTSVAYKEKRSALLREDYWEWLAKGEQGICSINDAFIDDIAARRQECGKILSGIYRVVLFMELSSDFIRKC